MMAVGIIAVTTSVLLLLAAGIYAMMPFTVARRVARLASARPLAPPLVAC
jgi:hypothetical protein